MLNKTLVAAAAKVMASPSPSGFFVSAHFLSSDPASKYSWYPLTIDEIIYNRDFIGKYADEIDLNLTISVADYGGLQDQGQNLLCVLTLTYVDEQGKILYTPTPVQVQYTAVINNPRDVRKAVPDVGAYQNPTIEISIRLIEPTVYALRHVKINKIYQNITMEAAIHSVTLSLGLTKLQMVKLDQTHQFDHVEIPPFQGIQTIYGFLQSKYGIYPKGIGYYITGGVLYIYPPFETAPTYDKTAIFYQVAKGDYAGAHVFHRVENKSVSIVLNSEVESYDQSIAGAENVGIGFIFSRASRMIDGITTIDSKNGAQYTENPSLSVSLDNARTAVSGQNNQFHIRPTDNPFPAMSAIAEHQSSIARVRWEGADPFQLDPGHAVAFYYDKDGVMVKKTGIVQEAKFRIVPTAKINQQDLFRCVGDLILRLSVNETEVL
jgi:hypothetical protein